MIPKIMPINELKNTSNISKEDMIQQLKTICTIKVENVEECMPDMI